MSKSYGLVQALDGVNLTLARGEVLGLLGPNGAGKTTLISAVAGLVSPDTGAIRLDGVERQNRSFEARGALSVVPQEIGIYLRLSVRKNLQFFGRLAGLSRAKLDARVAEIAELLMLEQILDRLADALSGGEKRRLHTAIALMHDAQLLLLDEPTAGADVDARNRLLEVVTMLADEGRAVCYATHYLQEVETLGASVAILEKGRLTARGSVSELIAEHDGSVIEVRLKESFSASVVADLGTVDADRLLRIHTSEPGADLPRVVGAFGRDADQIESVEIVRPSLESAYLAVTGHRFISENGTGGGV